MTTTTATVTSSASREGSGVAASPAAAAITPLPSPRAFRETLPLSAGVGETIRSGRETVRRIAEREDPRFLVVVGPCSLHDVEASLEYAERLAGLHRRYADRLYIVMRAYF